MVHRTFYHLLGIGDGFPNTSLVLTEPVGPEKKENHVTSSSLILAFFFRLSGEWGEESEWRELVVWMQRLLVRQRHRTQHQ